MASNSKGKVADLRPKKPTFLGVHRLRRHGNEWYFYGQDVEKGEHVRKYRDNGKPVIVRMHWSFLVGPAVPFLLSILAFIGVLWVSVLLPFLGALWVFFDGLVFLLILATGLRFVYKDWILWHNKVYIVTNKNIISYEGFLEPKRKITEIDKVQEIGIEHEWPWGSLLDYGVLDLYLQRGDLRMEHIGNPSRVRDAILGIAKEVQAKKSKDSIPELKDSGLNDLLKELGKQKPLPKLGNEDKEGRARR